MRFRKRQTLRHAVPPTSADYPGTQTASATSTADPADVRIIDAVASFTMTSRERLLALVDAVRYICRHRVEGAVVECGVWKGGSMMAAALTLLSENEYRQLYLFDTFEGMTPPTDRDVDYAGNSARRLLDDDPTRSGAFWAAGPIDDVKRNMASTSYPADKLHFVRGDVMATVPSEAPPAIAILRLDTDWYESTRHELRHLVPRISPFGVLIVDDYGHYRGAREAVDEYLAETALPVLLNRIDYTGRIAVIPPN